jgi:catechol-2,3-dioxygenase
MIQTFGVSHIQIAVKDLERSANFYQKLFGMKELRRMENVMMLQTPGSSEVFTINQDTDHQEIGHMGGIAHFGFRLREPMDMQEIIRAASNLGAIPTVHGGSEEKGRLYAFVKDPDGYELEIFWERD